MHTTGGRWREEWQLSRLVERLGSRLFRVTKPFLAEGSGVQAACPEWRQRRRRLCVLHVCHAFQLPCCPSPRCESACPSSLPAARTRMRLADYAAYCDQQHDEEPLYIFDA